MDPSTLDVGPEIDVEDLVAKVKAIVQTRPDEATGGRADDPGDGAALRAALQAQTEFNRSLVELLGSLARQLRGLDERLAAFERRPGEDARRAVNGAANGAPRG